MIPRQATSTLQRLAQGFPVLAITGPRQSGKTTLARAMFAAKPYVSLENP
jgi:predicted AAA+ superfamily ATPase